MAVFQDGIGSKNFVPRGGQVTTTSIDTGEVSTPVLKEEVPEVTDFPGPSGGSSTGSPSGGSSSEGSSSVGPVDTSTPATTGREMETGGCKANCGDPGPSSSSGNVPQEGEGRTANTDPNAENNPPPKTPARGGAQTANVNALAGLGATQFLLLGFAIPFIFSLFVGK